MDTSKARRVLDGDKSTVPENLPITVDGSNLTVPGKDGKPTINKVGCDGITMDVRSEWVYFAPLTGRSVYRVRVADLNDEKLTPTELSGKVERCSDKPNNGGLSIDYAGNLHLTAVETKSIGVVGADRKYRTYLSDPEMTWPDGIAAGPDGYMYVSASQISAAAMFNEGNAKNKEPYLIYRFKPVTSGYISRSNHAEAKPTPSYRSNHTRPSGTYAAQRQLARHLERRLGRLRNDCRPHKSTARYRLRRL
jgi:hypothetical protein